MKSARRDHLGQLLELTGRRNAILASLQEQGKLTDDLRAKVNAAATMTVLEDIYLPYRPKRRTRGTMAKEKGLEPLAKFIFEQAPGDVHSQAAAHVDTAKGVDDIESALAGARDISAEWVNEEVAARAEIRHLFTASGVLKTHVITGKETEGIKYKDLGVLAAAIAQAQER